MATTVTLNGTNYSVPANMETTAWGTSLSAYLVALSTGVLQKAGGSFTLTADADFGPNYGLKVAYLSARSSAAAAGVVRLANTDKLSWRNSTNSADVYLRVDSSNKFDFNGSAVSATELGYLAGVTSAIQTQINTKVTSGGALGTPSSGSLVNCTGYPISAVTGQAPGVTTFLTTPSSANFASMITDEVGTGSVVLNTDPNFNTRIGLLAQAAARFYDSDSSNYVDVRAPGTIATNFTLTLPTSAGSANQVLATDGSGNLSWATPFTNPMSAQGDMVYGGVAGASTRLAVGTAGAVLTGGTTPAWSSVLYVTSGKVGIGLGSGTPLAMTQIRTASSGVTPTSEADELFIENSGDAGLTISSGTTNTSRIVFSDSAAANGAIVYNNSTDVLQLYAGGVLAVHTNASRQTAIGGASTFVSSELLRLYKTGHTGVLWTWGNDTSSGTFDFGYMYDGSGDLVGSVTANATANTTSWNTSSDRTLKTNFRDYSALDLIQAVKPQVYERISNPGVDEYGFVAQDLAPVLPQAVTPPGGQREYWSVDYSKVTAVLWKALHELKEENDGLKTRISALENVK